MNTERTWLHMLSQKFVEPVKEIVKISRLWSEQLSSQNKGDKHKQLANNRQQSPSKTPPPQMMYPIEN